MATLRVQQLTSVYSAMSECDQVGTAAFLQKYDCGIPKKFWIDHDDKKFPAKAILYVAHRLVHPEDQHKCSGFVSSEKTVPPALERLGFRVVTFQNSVTCQFSQA